jgi:uncharacterized protein involved in exopolysaccharide biosynthesis
VGAAVLKTYDTPDGPRNLMEYYEVDGATAQARLNAAIGKLLKNISITSDVTTNVVTMRVSGASGPVVTQINRNLLDLVHTFNVEKRRTQANTERAFLQARVADARAELRDAEAKLQAFFSRNRTYQTSPQLTFEANRLQQDLTMKRTMFESLAQSYERARIDAVRTSPMFTIIDPPEGSARPEGHGPLPRAILGALAGLLIAGALAILKEFAEQSRRQYPEEYNEFARLRSRLIPFRRYAVR